VTSSDALMSRPLAISLSAFQNASSTVTLVLRPEMTMERLTPPCVRSSEASRAGAASLGVWLLPVLCVGAFFALKYGANFGKTLTAKVRAPPFEFGPKRFADFLQLLQEACANIIVHGANIPPTPSPFHGRRRSLIRLQ
jgi:hypothetical protein